MKEIILDTNFLMAVGQFKVDIFSEINRICTFPYRISVLDKTLLELKKIQKEQSGRHKRAASLALSLVKAKKTKVIKTRAGKGVDELLVEYSKKGALVGTQDLALKKRLKKPYLVLRQKKRLMIYP